MRVLFLVVLLVFSLSSCNNNQSQGEKISEANNKPKVLTTAETLAYKSGFEKFDQLNSLAFTFNVDRGDSHYERSWVWYPKKDVVKMMNAKDTISFNRASIDSTNVSYDSAFINDKYWLLAPFNLIWDEGVTFSKAIKTTAPISGKNVNMLTITYGDEGGYTPGDAYDLYYEDDFLLTEWAFRKGNDSLPSMITTWEDYREFKGIKIATMHKDSTSNFKLYFTDIKLD